MAVAPAAGAAQHKPAAPRFKCPKGFKKVKVTVTRHGKKKVVYRCHRKPSSVKTVPVRPSPLTPPPIHIDAAPASKQASTTTIAAAYQGLAPARVGFGEFRLGQYTITGSVSPFAVPELRCAGAAGCIEPAGNLQGGPLTVPVLAQVEYVKKVPTWKVGVPPAQGAPTWLTLPEAASGGHFFQAVGAPDPSMFLPSTAQAPIQISPGLPAVLHRQTGVEADISNEEFPEGLGNFGQANGNFKKVNGASYDLVIESNEEVAAGNSSGCEYQLRLNGVKPTGGDLAWKNGRAVSVFTGLIPLSWTIELSVRHKPGTGHCALTQDSTYLVTEEPHV